MFLKYFIYDLQKRYNDAQIKRWINEHPKEIIYAAGASVLLLLIVIIVLLIPDNQPAKAKTRYAWFYDLNTDKLFKADSDMRPPIEAPSGTLPDGSDAGVRAYVFTTVKEPNESEVIIAYLEKLSSEAPEILSSKSETTAKSQEIIRQWAKGRFVRRVQDANWFAADSPQAIDIIQMRFVPENMRYNLRPYPAK